MSSYGPLLIGDGVARLGRCRSNRSGLLSSNKNWLTMQRLVKLKPDGECFTRFDGLNQLMRSTTAPWPNGQRKRLKISRGGRSRSV
jgi:hypothetical protein